MIGKHFGRTIHVPGTLSANLAITISVPVDCRLKRVSAVGSNANDATLEIGVGSDADNIMAAAAIGDSHVPVVFDTDDWAATNASGRLNQGDLLKLVVDFDGSAGTAAQNLTLDLDFIEG
jgi:hypothetical protein